MPVLCPTFCTPWPSGPLELPCPPMSSRAGQLLDQDPASRDAGQKLGGQWQDQNGHGAQWALGLTALLQVSSRVPAQTHF